MPDSMIQIAYIVSAILLVFGLKRLSTPSHAKNGLMLAGLGLAIAVVLTYVLKDLNNYVLMTFALLIGGTLGFLKAKNSINDDMPAISALFSGMGGATVTAIAIIPFIKLAPLADSAKYLALLGVLLGSISFSGSIVAYAKCKNWIKNTIDLPMHHWLNALVLVITLTFGVAIVLNGANFDINYLIVCLTLSLLLGALILLPIDNDDLPISYALLSSCSGFAVGCIGYALANPLIMIMGVLAGAIALTLGKQISDSRKRPLPSMIFGDEESIKAEKKNSTKTNS